MEFMVYGTVIKDIESQEYKIEDKTLHSKKMTIEEIVVGRNGENKTYIYEITFYSQDIAKIPVDIDLMGARVYVFGEVSSATTRENRIFYKLRGKRLIVVDNEDYEIGEPTK